MEGSDMIRRLLNMLEESSRQGTSQSSDLIIPRTDMESKMYKLEPSSKT